MRNVLDEWSRTDHTTPQHANTTASALQKFVPPLGIRAVLCLLLVANPANWRGWPQGVSAGHRKLNSSTESPNVSPAYSWAPRERSPGRSRT